MPTYSYSCECGAEFERVLPLRDYNAPQACACGRVARKLITAPQLMIPQDIHYQSPIDGRPITSAKARADDLARSGCIPYDPGMKQDELRRMKESDARLEKAVEDTVERTVSEMPSEKRERLQAELDGGLTAEPVRGTANMKPIETKVHHA